MHEDAPHHRNGMAPSGPRRIGAVPYYPVAGGLCQLEQWSLPGVGIRWCVSRGGIYLAPCNLGPAYDPEATAADAIHCRDAELAKAAADAWLPPDSGPAEAPAHRVGSLAARPHAAASLLYRADGLDWRLEERPAGGSWRVRLGDRLLNVEGTDLVSLVPFAAIPEAVEFLDAGAAQAAIERYLDGRRRPVVAARVRAAVDAADRGELEMDVSRRELDGSWSVTFRPRGGRD